MKIAKKQVRIIKKIREAVNIVILPVFSRIESLSPATCNQRSFANPLITSLFTDQARM